MRSWALLLSGLIVWTVHFFALYLVASIWLTSPLARVLTGVITLACLAAIAASLPAVRRISTRDAMDGWMRSVATVGLGIAAVAIVWQGLPALLS